MGSARAQNPARGGACARRKSHGAAGCFARLQLVGGEFALKKRALRNQRNLLSHSALTIKSGHIILVLTEKTGLFWVVLAGKSMFCEIKTEFAFEFLWFLEIFRAASRCREATTIDSDPSKKIIPKSLR